MISLQEKYNISRGFYRIQFKFLKGISVYSTTYRRYIINFLQELLYMIWKLILENSGNDKKSKRNMANLKLRLEKLKKLNYHPYEHTALILRVRKPYANQQYTSEHLNHINGCNEKAIRENSCVRCTDQSCKRAGCAWGNELALNTWTILPGRKAHYRMTRKTSR